MGWSFVFDTVLENDGVLLRPLVRSDRDALAEIAFEPSIWRYFVGRIDDESGLDRFLDAGLADMKAERRAVFVVVEKASGQLAGSMCFGNLAEADRRVEIGWSWLGKRFQGTGVNRWAKLALLSEAFGPMRCERVEFKTDVLNQQARRGLARIGAQEEGVLRSFNDMPDGRRRDAVYYSILKAEWPKVRAELGPR